MQDKKVIIFTDCGDTIIDESTEVRREQYGVVYAAECIPGAKESLQMLWREGYRIALVADGLNQSFRNCLQMNDIEHVFEGWTVSETVGEEKPSPRMFQDAMDQMGLTAQDKPRIIMVGNNIKRDIVGANRFGLISVLLSWSPRYCMVPENAEEQPDYVISTPKELAELVHMLEEKMQH